VSEFLKRKIYICTTTKKKGRFVYLCINAGHEFGTSVRMLWINELEDNLLVLIVQSAMIARHAAFWREPCGAVRKAAGLAILAVVGHVGESILSTLKRAHLTLLVYVAGFLQTGVD
jgi:hypothetical protein